MRLTQMSAENAADCARLNESKTADYLCPKIDAAPVGRSVPNLINILRL